MSVCICDLGCCCIQRHLTRSLGGGVQSLIAPVCKSSMSPSWLVPACLRLPPRKVSHNWLAWDKLPVVTEHKDRMLAALAAANTCILRAIPSIRRLHGIHRLQEGRHCNSRSFACMQSATGFFWSANFLDHPSASAVLAVSAGSKDGAPWWLVVSVLYIYTHIRTHTHTHTHTHKNSALDWSAEILPVDRFHCAVHSHANYSGSCAVLLNDECPWTQCTSRDNNANTPAGRCR